MQEVTKERIEKTVNTMSDWINSGKISINKVPETINAFSELIEKLNSIENESLSTYYVSERIANIHDYEVKLENTRVLCYDLREALKQESLDAEYANRQINRIVEKISELIDFEFFLDRRKVIIRKDIQ